MNRDCYELRDRKTGTATSYETVIGTAGNDSEGSKRRFVSTFFDWKPSTRNIDILMMMKHDKYRL